jgi:putative transposase
MPRPRRLDFPGVPHHVVIRGNNRTDLFWDDNDRMLFLRYVGQSAEASACEVHAFVMMTNHVHLLVTTRAGGGLSRFVQAIGRRYSRYANRVHGRTGTLFEGRFHSSLVECERYLFTCMRYIELNPVRAGLAADPADYAWSSYRDNAGLERRFGWLVPRMEYCALGSDVRTRGEAYRRLYAVPIAGPDLDVIRDGARKSCPIGSLPFVDRIEQALGRPVLTAPRGRPRKQKVI